MNKPLHQIIERPIITEKSVKASMNNRYTFKCNTDANKIEIKAAIQEAFGVKVATVNTLIIKGKHKQVGRGRPGKVADYKKAMVTLASGESDARLKEIFEGA